MTKGSETARDGHRELYYQDVKLSPKEQDVIAETPAAHRDAVRDALKLARFEKERKGEVRESKAVQADLLDVKSCLVIGPIALGLFFGAMVIGYTYFGVLGVIAAPILLVLLYDHRKKGDM